MHQNSESKSYFDDNYGDILSDNSFTDEHVHSDYPNKTPSDNKITANSGQY